MSASLLDGNKIASEIRGEVAAEVRTMTAAGVRPGLAVILGGHTATERGYLPRLAGLLGERLPGAKFVVSAADRDPAVTR